MFLSASIHAGLSHCQSLTQAPRAFLSMVALTPALGSMYGKHVATGTGRHDRQWALLRESGVTGWADQCELHIEVSVSFPWEGRRSLLLTSQDLFPHYLPFLSLCCHWILSHWPHWAAGNVDVAASYGSSEAEKSSGWDFSICQRAVPWTMQKAVGKLRLETICSSNLMASVLG